MQWSFHRVPVLGDAAAEEFNRFLKSVRVLTVHREFVNQGETSYWALAVEYLPPASGRSGKDSSPAEGRTDFKQLLSPDEFNLFSRLRAWRKETAEQEGTPVYTVFTNDQLASMARNKCASMTSLATIDGVGAGRLEKFGPAVLAVIRGGAHDGTTEPDVIDRRSGEPASGLSQGCSGQT